MCQKPILKAYPLSDVEETAVPPYHADDAAPAAILRLSLDVSKIFSSLSIYNIIKNKITLVRIRIEYNIL